jgi:hypothetical protein
MHLSKKDGFLLITASAAGFFCGTTLLSYKINGQAGLNGPDVGSNITRAITDTGKAALTYVVIPVAGLWTVVSLACLVSPRHRHR